MIDFPTTLSDIHKLIQDQVQEGTYLEYKDSRALDPGKKEEISKDVSAFANSDGGILIYGVAEDNNLPTGTDKGIDHQAFDRERLEQIILHNITPRIDGILIVAIPLSSQRSIYVVKIPRSARGPHQAGDRKYYKRFNFIATAMADYEINDVRNRRSVVTPLVTIELETGKGTAAYIKLSNIGSQTAQDLTFSWSTEFQLWIDENSPSLFTRGIKHLPPKRSHTFIYGTFGQAFDGKQRSAEFEISVTYFHPEVGQRITDVFNFDLMDYWNSLAKESEVNEIGKAIKDSIDKLTEQVKQLNVKVDKISWIAGHTGLDISVTSLRNLMHLQAGDGQIEKIDIHTASYGTLEEILSINFDMAWTISNHFRNENSGGLSSIKGMTEELAEKIMKYFLLPPGKQEDLSAT